MDEGSPPVIPCPSGDVSTLGHTTQESQLYRGRKGSFHRQHKNKRASSKTDWVEKFMETICDGDVDEYEALKKGSTF